MGMTDQECPLFYHHLALASYLCSSWRLKGSGVAWAEALLARLRSLGGDLVCGDPVEAIALSGGAVSGVRLASGREVRASRVIAAIHPKEALGLLPVGAVKERHGRRIGELEETEGLFTLNALLDARSHPPLAYNLFRIYAAPEGEVNDGVFYQLRPGGPGKTLLVAMTRSPFADWSAWVGTRTGRRGSAYAEEKALRAQCLLSQAEALFGSLKDAQVIDCATPLTLRDWMGAPQGAPYGILRSLRQLPLVGAIQRLAPPGLWFAGQNALSPGILGTLLGSLQTLRQLIGPERFHREVYRRLTGD
jgi:phytoene dehydrogenase-like protein